MSNCFNRNLLQGRQLSIGHSGSAPGRNPGGNHPYSQSNVAMFPKVFSQFNQTHSQALQTQIQAIQILLDKQGTIVSAVLPLLPLLQAVPLHIEATRNALNDAISKLTLTQKLTSDSPNQNVAIKISEKRKQSQRSPSSSPLAESPCKRRRSFTGNVLKEATPTVQSSLENLDVTSSVRQHRPFELSSSSTVKSHSPLQKSSPLTHLANTHTSTSSLGRRNTFVLPNFSTPRKPLPVQPSRQSALKLSNALIHGNSVPRSNTMSRTSPQVLPDITPTAARPPRMLRAHASISNNIRNKPFSGPDMSTTTTTNENPPLSPASAFLPNHPAMSDPQNGPSTISRNGFAYKQTVDQIPLPNQNFLSPLENRPTDLVKSRVVPTAVALNNMKEAPVSRI